MSDPVTRLNAALLKRSSKYLVSAFIGLAAGLCAIAGMVLR